MALDPLSIASDGLLSKYKWTLSAATLGYLSQFAIVAIPIPTGAAGEAFGYLFVEDKEMPKKESRLHQEDSEIMLLMQIFMMRWN
jgi:hypothetical protein